MNQEPGTDPYVLPGMRTSTKGGRFGLREVRGAAATGAARASTGRCKRTDQR